MSVLDYKTLKGLPWAGDGGLASHYGHQRGTRCAGGQNTASGSAGSAWHYREPDYESHRLRLLTDERGSIIDFLIVSILTFFLLFAGVDYYVTLMQHQIAEHIMHYYLERIRVEGFLTTADESEMRAKYNSVGLPVESISCPLQSQGASRVLRNPQNPDASRINVTVTCKPVQRPFLIGKLIGGLTAPDTFRIRVGGSVLSERVDP